MTRVVAPRRIASHDSGAISYDGLRIMLVLASDFVQAEPSFLEIYLSNFYALLPADVLTR